MRRGPAAIRRMGRDLAERCRRDGSHPLLLLPSTPAAFSLVERYTETGLPMEIVGNAALLRDWMPGLAGRAHTPLALWRKVRDAATLPFAVASFQDQLVHVDDSFHAVPVDGQTYRVSPVEAMLRMRFRPHTWLGRVAPGRSPRSPSSLSLESDPAILPEAPSRAAFETELARLLRPLLACQDPRIGDWRARRTFALKVGRNHDRMLAQRLQEIEALIRVHQDRQGPQSSLAALMGTLRANRQDLLAGVD